MSSAPGNVCHAETIMMATQARLGLPRMLSSSGPIPSEVAIEGRVLAKR